MKSLYEITENFLINEWYEEKPGVLSYIQSIEEVLHSISPTTKKDIRRLEIAKENLKNIKRYSRKAEQEIFKLQEKLSILEENK